jgi:hypothetical protein
MCCISFSAFTSLCVFGRLWRIGQQACNFSHTRANNDALFHVCLRFWCDVAFDEISVDVAKRMGVVG